MISRTFTTFDIIITATNHHEKAASIFIFIPLLASGSYWARIGGKDVLKLNLIREVYIITKGSKGTNSLGFPLILCRFVIIIFYINLWGLVPGVFPVSSHISLTLSLAGPLWGSIVLIGIVSWYRGIVSTFLPSGSSASLSPFLILIEGVRSLIRPLTLAFRLSANITAGHVILGLMSGFALKASITPFFFIVPMGYTIFEVGISLAQAYVFVLLSRIYFRDYIKS